jgi:kynurenine 3-monooxygenase
VFPSRLLSQFLGLCEYELRRELNKFLLTAAEQEGVSTFFSHRLTDLDLSSSDHVGLTFAVQSNDGSSSSSSVQAKFVFGADGGGSAVRGELKKAGRMNFVVEDLLEYGYKEVTFPARNGQYPMESSSLHIWPRGSHMLMGLADLYNSFTGS